MYENSVLASGRPVLDDSLRSCKARNGDSRCRAGDVVEARQVAELDGIGVAAVFAADTDFNPGVRLPAKNHTDAHKLAHALLVDALEWVDVQDLRLEVGRQEGSCGIITAIGIRCLGEVVGSEAEEVGVVGDLVCSQAGTGNFDHGTDLDVSPDTLAVEYQIELFLHQRLEYLDLIDVTHQWKHDLGHRVKSSLDQGSSRLGDGMDLQLIDLGVNDSDAAAAEPDHRVELFQLVVSFNDLFYVGGTNWVIRSLGLRQLTHETVPLGKELVERRVQQADDDRETVHGLKDLLEIAPLHRKQFLEGSGALLERTGNNHLLHKGKAIGIVEHALGTAQSYTLCAECTCFPSVGGRVCIGAYAETANTVCITKQGRKFGGLLGIHHWGLTKDDFASGAVHRDDVAFVDGHTICHEGFFGAVEFYLIGANHTRLAETTRYKRCMGRGATTGRQCRLSLGNTIDVLRRRVLTNKNNLLSSFSKLGGLL